MSWLRAITVLFGTEPLRPLEHYVEKYSGQGFLGEALWERIIRGGTTPNPAVYAAYGVR